jgi:muramoyltetrapeptide carboxypeptidase
MKKSLKKQSAPLVDVVAVSSVIPLHDLKLGLSILSEYQYEHRLSQNISKKYFSFAGTDPERLAGFCKAAWATDSQILWCARGGYGAVRLIEGLLAETKKRGKPPFKVLVGFSDLTILLDFVAREWGWRVVHGPMLATTTFSKIQKKVFDEIESCLRADVQKLTPRSLKLLLAPQTQRSKISNLVAGELVGGNLMSLLSQWQSQSAPVVKNNILFLEEVSEAPYQMDRMVQMLLQVNAFKGVKAIVLGTFDQCGDRVLKDSRGHAIRAQQSLQKWLVQIFEPVSERYSIPIFYGLKSGHGEDGVWPLLMHHSVKIFKHQSHFRLEWKD